MEMIQTTIADAPKSNIEIRLIASGYSSYTPNAVNQLRDWKKPTCEAFENGALATKGGKLAKLLNPSEELNNLRRT